MGVSQIEPVWTESSMRCSPTKTNNKELLPLSCDTKLLTLPRPTTDR